MSVLDEINSPVHWLSRNARNHPSATALIYGDLHLSHKDLFDQVLLRAQNIQGEGYIHVMKAEDPLETALTFHAAPQAGSAFLPLDPNMDKDRHQAFMKNVVPTRPFDTSPPDPSAVHLIIATSGTSGTPKGVMLSGRNLTVAAHASRDRLGLTPDDRWLACLPLFHIGGLSILSRCAEAGATAVLQDGFNVQDTLAAIDDHAITHLSLVPTMLHRLLDELDDTPPPGRLKRVLVGGAAISAQLAHRARQAGWPICPTYGMSETASQLATLTKLPHDWEEGHVGPPLDGFEIAREDNRIKVRGEAVMHGYITPERTAGVGLTQGWYITGDLAHQSGDGDLHIIGRADDAFNVGGETIHPATVERRFAQCPDITEVAITTQADPEWGERLVAIFTGTANTSDVRTYADQHLKGPYRPAKILKQSALPRNAMGKLDRQRLKELVISAKPV